jgi:hypothetical protein
VDFEFEHRFPFARDVVAETLLNLDFQESLDGLGPLAERKVISQTARGSRVVRRTRCVLGIELPAAARRFVGTGPAAWIEEAAWDPGAMAWDWIIHPETGGDLLRSKGRIELIDRKPATIRRVLGMVRVGVPILGGRVETRIVRALGDAYAEEGHRLATWIEAGPRGVTRS